MAEEQRSNALFDEVMEPVPFGAAHSENIDTGEETPASPPDESVKDTQQGEDPGITLEGLQSQVDGLLRANRGLKNDLVDQRGRRAQQEAVSQQLQGKIDQISNTFSQALQARQGPEEIPEEQRVPGKLPVDFEDDGTPFVDTKGIFDLQTGEMQKVQSQIQPNIQELQNQLAQLTAYTSHKEALDQQTRGLNALIGSNPSYPDGLKQLTGQWQALNSMFESFLSDNSLPVPKSIDEAISVILSSPVKTAFQKQFPNTDVELLTEAFTTPNQAILERKLKRMLDGITPQIPATQLEQGMGETLTALAKKPGNLSGVRNQAASAETTLSRVEAMSQDDFNKLSDSDMDKIHDLLAQEER